MSGGPAPGPGPAVRVEGLSKLYRLAKGPAVLPPLLPWRKPDLGARAKEVWALDDVAFDVPAGQVLGVIGPNGAGKSTLLKVLARVTPPTRGRVTVRGRVVSLLELGAAFSADATGRENVYLNAALNGIPRSVVDRRMPEIVAFAGLEDFLDTPVSRYSSGMYLRLAFSVAVNMEPSVLLADEILAVGDLEFQERSLERVAEESAKGLTVLFVSHDMEAVRRLCDRVIWLAGGRIQADGDPDDVIDAYQESVWTATGAAASERGAHRNDVAEIVSVAMEAPGGGEVGAVRVGDAFDVVVRFRLDRAPVRARCALAFSAHHTVAFKTVQPQAMELAEPGVYEGRVRVPAHLLADTSYDVKAAVGLGHEGRDATVVKHHALAFTVYDPDPERSARGTYEEDLSGAVRPKLDWAFAPAPASRSTASATRGATG